MRELKKVKKKKTGEPGPAYISCWPLFDAMLFLSDSVKHRSTVTNFPSSQHPGSPSASGPISLTKEHGTDEQWHLEENTEQEPEDQLVGRPAPLPSCSSDSSSRAVSTEPDVLCRPPSKERKGDDVDKAIVESLKTMQDRWSRKDTENSQATLDEEGHFGHQVAATLRRLTTKQKVIAKLQIDQVLVNVEFPPENPFSPSPNHYAF